MGHIAYLGTGLLGGAFAQAAAQRGDQVVVWNRSREKAARLSVFGAIVADSPAEAVAGASRVHLTLTDDDVVESVMRAARPALSGDTAVVDHSTTQPVRTAARTAAYHADGVRYLHAPVFIGPAAALEAKGTVLACGDRSIFMAVEPALRRMAERVDFLGERADIAAIVKLMGNACFIGLGGLASDLVSIASGAGLPPAEAARVLDYFEPANVLRNRIKRMVQRDYAATFELTMARKDVRLMQEAADGLPLSALEGIANRMDALIAEGNGSSDLGVMADGAITRAGIT